jgi:hypothetical protein
MLSCEMKLKWTRTSSTLRKTVSLCKQIFILFAVCLRILVSHEYILHPQRNRRASRQTWHQISLSVP